MRASLASIRRWNKVGDPPKVPGRCRAAAPPSNPRLDIGPKFPARPPAILARGTGRKHGSPSDAEHRFYWLASCAFGQVTLSAGTDRRLMTGKGCRSGAGAAGRPPWTASGERATMTDLDRPREFGR